MGNEEEIQGGVRKPRESNHRDLSTSLRAGGWGGGGSESVVSKKVGK